MTEKRARVRLSDVAQEANVSAATVSRLMSGRASVNPETRARVIQAAKRLDFNLETKSRGLWVLYSATAVCSTRSTHRF
jgi:LacI family transcriptional regulator